MPITQLIAAGNTATQSAERTVAAGAAETLLFRASGMDCAQCTVQQKDSLGGYQDIGALGDSFRSRQLAGPVTYRVARSAGRNNSAVDVET